MNTQLATVDNTSINLTQLGLKEDDLPRIDELRTQLTTAGAEQVRVFGRDAGRNTADFADAILSQVNNRDLEETGEKLGKVVTLARRIDMGQLAKRSKVPVVGRWIDKMRDAREGMLQSFADTRTQIDQLVLHVQSSSEGLSTRNAQLDVMAERVRDDYHNAGLHVAAGELALQDLRVRHAALAAEAVGNPMQVQEVSELEATINLLDKRVADLRVLQQAALQTLPTIRMIQSQNNLLQDKFQNVKDLTIPAWKRQVVLQLSLRDQEQAVRLANDIDDTTNLMLRTSADLLRDNAVATAKANQRLVIDVESLEYAHKQLIATIEDVKATNAEGLKQREQTQQRLQELRNDLQARLVAPAPKALQ